MPSPKRPVTVRVARWSATHPWRAIALWLAFVFACIALGSLAGLHEMSDIDSTTGQSRTAAQWLHDAHLESPDTETVLVTAPSGRLDTAAATQVAAEAGARMRRAAAGHRGREADRVARPIGGRRPGHARATTPTSRRCRT